MTSRTIAVARDGKTPTAAVDVVYSPDDGGHYLSHHDFNGNKCRASVRIYPTEQAAVADYRSGAVKWERWS